MYHDMPEMALQGTVNENNQHFSWHNNGEKRKGEHKNGYIKAKRS